MNERNVTDANLRQTIVEEGSEFSGKLNSKVNILAHGRLEGELTAPALSISTTGAVHGKVRVTSLESQGEISGDLEADTMRLAGAVRDNTVLRAKTLEVRLSGETGARQVVFGECELQIGEAPDDEKGAAKKPSAGRNKGRRGGQEAGAAESAPRSAESASQPEAEK